MVNSLSLKLKLNLNFAFYHKLKRINYFEKKNNDFISTIGDKLSLIIFNKDDIIFEKNNYAEEIFFIKKGNIKVMGDGGKTLYTICEGNYFGEWDIFFNKSEREFTVISIDKSILYYLKKEDFNEIYFNNFIQYKQEMISNSYKRLKNWQEINLKNKIKQNLFKKKYISKFRTNKNLNCLKKAKDLYYKVNKNDNSLILKIDSFNKSIDKLNLKLWKFLKHK